MQAKDLIGKKALRSAPVTYCNGVKDRSHMDRDPIIIVAVSDTHIAYRYADCKIFGDKVMYAGPDWMDDNWVLLPEDKPQESPARRYTMEDFKREKISVKTETAEQKAIVVSSAKRAGFHFTAHDDEMISSGRRRGNDYFFLDPRLGVGFMGFTAYERDDCAAVPFSSFDFSQPLTVSPPLFTCTVTDSTTSAEVNAIIDNLRAIRYAKQQAEQPKPAQPQYVEVKRKAEKGDRVKVINGYGAVGGYANGDVFNVIGTNQGLPEIVDKDGDKRVLAHDEYVVLDPIPATPAQPRKPKAGELVQVLKRSADGDLDVGGIVKIESFCKLYNHAEARDKNRKLCCMRDGTYLPVREEERPAKVGEWVKVGDKYASSGYEPGKLVQCVRKCDDGADLFSDNRYMLPKRYRVLVPFSPEVAHE